MSDLSQTVPTEARRERRRLHLREVAELPTTVEQPAVVEEPEDLPPAAPSNTVGELLRAARLSRGEEASSVAALLKMRREQLEAVEAGDLAKLPGRTYAVGFVRAYARHLGLNADDMVQRFKDETAATDKPVDLVFPQAQEEFRRPSGSILTLGLLIAMTIYGISYVTTPDRAAMNSTAQAEETSAVVVEHPAAAVPQVAATEAEKVPVEVAVSFVAGAQTLPEEKLPAPALEVAPAPAAATPFAVAELDAAPKPQTAQSSTRITLKAVEPTYVQIRDTQLPRSRSIMVARVLNVGESYSVPDRPGLIMQTGNAGGLQVEVDGRSLGVFGRSGEVITRIPLDPSYFLERMAASR
jgi:cytoskeleton protein RodZ